MVGLPLLPLKLKIHHVNNLYSKSDWWSPVGYALYMSYSTSPFWQALYSLPSPERWEEKNVLPIFAYDFRMWNHLRKFWVSVNFWSLCSAWTRELALLISFQVLLLKKFRKWCFSLRYFWDLTASDSALVDLSCFCQSDLALRCTAGDSVFADLLYFD